MLHNNINIKKALEELNFIQQGDYSDDEFTLKFRLRANKVMRITDLTDLQVVANVLDVNLPDMVKSLSGLLVK